MPAAYILLFYSSAILWLVSSMLSRKTMREILAFLSAWGVLFTVPFFITDFPSTLKWQLGLITTAGISILAICYFVLSTEPKPKSIVKAEPIAIIEPEIKMSAFFQTIPPDDDVVRFDYHVKAGEKHIPALEAQVSHGYGRPLMWAALDLRRDTFEQERTGKPVKRISLIPYEEYWFTFVAIRANSRQASMKTINPPTEVPFDPITWKTPFPEVYIRFLGMRKQIEQGWIIGFNKPPWTPLAKPPNLPVDLWPVDSPEGKAMRTKREKQAGRETSDIKYTAVSKDSNMGVSITSPEEEAKKHLPPSP